MKPLFKYLTLGLTSFVVTLVLALIMLKVTMNFQLLLFIGFALFFIAGFLNSKLQINSVLAALIITGLYLILFAFEVLSQLPSLYYFIPIYFIACFLGLKYKVHKKSVVISSFFLTIFLLFVAIYIIPIDIEKSLTQQKFEPLPFFQLTELDGTNVSSKDLQGKVIVLDFFGTWCAPCRKELPELQKVQNTFKHRDDVVFYVINTDIGGDTPEKFENFIKENSYNFKFVYDHNSTIYKHLSLENSGLPVLLVVDKSQNVRMQHIGFNAAETSFRDNLVKTIERLF